MCVRVCGCGSDRAVKHVAELADAGGGGHLALVVGAPQGAEDGVEEAPRVAPAATAARALEPAADTLGRGLAGSYI